LYIVIFFVFVFRQQTRRYIHILLKVIHIN
jgi:hypothetical protein